MFYLFEFFYFVGWTLVLPVLILMSYAVKPKWRLGLNDRLGFLSKIDFPEMKSSVQPLWFHAVSVGELNALAPLLKNFFGLKLILSVTTETAYRLALKKFADDIENNRIKLIFMPWDHPYIIDKVLKRISPQVIILIESEIWPGLIVKAKQKKISIVIINAKISDSSFRFYKIGFLFFRKLFSLIDLVIAQSPEYSRRFMELGVERDRIFMTGNLKFALIPEGNLSKTSQRKALCFNDDDVVIVCGSTHEEEEATLIGIYQEIKSNYPHLRLVIAPRHPERFSVVYDLVNCAAQLQPVYFSKRQKLSSNNDVLIIDTIGDLLKFYAIADIAFVGGTLNERIGGHNVLEPAVFKVPVVIGPHFKSNEQIVNLMYEADALYIAETKEDLRHYIISLIDNSDRRILMGANGKNLTEANKKIIVKTTEILKSFLL